MSELERMQKYIDNTKLPDLSNYQMGLSEMMGLKEIDDTFAQVIMAFELGLAKGWRAHKNLCKK